MRLLLPLLAVPIASCLDAPTELATAEQTCQVQPVVGDLQVEGCTPPPGEILITATESTATQVGANAQPNPPEPVRALVLPTLNAHRYAVVFPLLKTHTMYTVSAAMTTAHCPQVAWQGAHGGVLVPGETPLHVTAYAMRTQTELLATRGPNHTPTWVGVDAIDIDAPGGGIRDLRWRTDIPGAVAGRLEIATSPFPVEVGGNQQEPPLAASFTVPLAQQGWSTVPAIDLAAPFQPPPCNQQQNPNGCQTQVTPEGMLHRELQAGAPIFARVVPVDAHGARLGGNTPFGIASTLRVAHTHLPVDMPPPPPPEPALLIDVASYDPPHPEIASGYNRGCYTVNTDHTFPTSYAGMTYWEMVLVGHYGFGATIHVGESWCLNHSSGTLDDIVDSISGLVDAVGDLVNSISKLYEDIKKGVVRAAAFAITEVGIGECGTDCQALLMAGLDAALAAVGMPPSLPNFDELADRGLDYLADAAAEETGIPAWAIEDARKIAAQTIRDMKTTNHIAAAPWLTADDGFRPANLRLFLRRNPTSTAALPGDLRIYSGITFHGTDLLVPPSLPSDDARVIDVQLLPDFSGIAPPACVPTTYATGLHSTGTVCIPLTDAEKQLYYEGQYIWKIITTPCDNLAGFTYGVGHFGDGALIYTPLMGFGLAWQYRPGLSQAIFTPFANTCT